MDLKFIKYINLKLLMKLMSSVKTIAKNTSFLLLADIIGKILSFFLVIAIARYLGDIGLGKYSFIFAFIGLFSIFSDFGTKTFMVREIARNEGKTKIYFDNILTLKLIFALATLISPLIMIHFIDKNPEVITGVYVIAVATFFLVFTELFNSLLQAYERMEYVSLIIVLERVITASLGIIILTIGFKLIALLFVFLFSYIIVFATAFSIISKKITRIRFRFDFDLWKDIFRNSLPFWFTALFVTIYFRIGSVMLSVMKGYQAVGWYSASYRMLDALYFIPNAVIMAVFPAMSKFHIKDKASLSKLYKKSFYYLLSAGLAIAIGTTLLADRIILFIYKEQFTNSITALQILIWAEMMIFISSLSGYLLNSIDKQKLFTYTTAFCALVNITLNYTLISKYSYIGAATAALITEILVFILLFYFVSKNKYGFNILEFIPKLAIACIGMSLFIIYFWHLHLLILIPLAGLVYYGILFLMKGVGSEEINMIRTLINKTS